MNDQGVNSFHFGNMFLHFSVCAFQCVCTSSVDAFMKPVSLSFVGLLIRGRFVVNIQNILICSDVVIGSYDALIY